MSTWVTACKFDDIDREDVARFDHGDKTYAIYRSADDEVFCTAGLCTHEAIHLADGLVMEYEIECPKHSSIFDYRTGEVLTPPACEDLRTYPARLNGEFVEIDVR
ncbi:MAG: MocE family 2Fe-2S type ferredoxin [Paracoccaceae bacterium]